ncbi:MAG: plastocyanin/azurin family copper-binding protein [Steroidobacteraceae bacterium]
MSFARHAPLALALLVAYAPAPAQDVDWGKAARIEVAMSNFKFNPDAIRMKAGQPYILHLSSTGGHSFEAKAFFTAANVLPADRIKAANGRIDLKSGASVDISLVAPGPASFDVRCTHFMHAGFGMTAKIIVD